MRKKIFILLFLMLVLMSISAVSAADADNNNATIVSSADAGTLALANDINAIDNLNGNYSDSDGKALENDAKPVAAGKNNGNDLLSADNNENGNILTAAPKTYYVNASAASGGTGTETAPFQTLNAALNKVNDGDTIMIAAGTYTGTDNTGLNINRNNLNFIKYGEGEAIFDAEIQRRIWTVWDDSINIIGLTFKNGINREGGAIYMMGGNVTNCTFTGNNATGDSTSAGGAIYCLFYTNVTNCNFTGNTAQYRGGAIYFMRGGNVSDCTFTGNTANWWGGAIRLETVDNTKGTVTNCAFVNNSAQNGKVISSSGVLESIDNNWWGSNDPDWNELINKGGIPSSYAVLNGSADSETIKPGYNAKLNYTFYMNGTANVLSIPSRPIELSATGGHLDDDTGYLVNGKFSTEFSSDALGEFEITATVDNQEVKLTETVAATVWYVNATAAPGGDGKSQATPFQTLKEALDVAEDYDTIMIAAGTYTGTNNRGLSIRNNISLEKYGEGEAIFDAEKSWRILNVYAGTINITGLTFKNGRSTYGGAIYFDNPVSNSNINAVFINNTADQGGAILFGGAFSNSIINATFINNSASREGGANYFASLSNVIIIGDFINNTLSKGSAGAGAYGGANYFYSYVENSNISGTYNHNTADRGGANYFNGYVENSNIDGAYTNNVATVHGGASYFKNPVTNSNISGTYNHNTAETGSGGANSISTVTNSNISGTYTNNVANDNGGANSISLTVTYSNITGTYINNTAGKKSIIYIDAYSTAPTNVIISNAVFLNNNYDKTYGVIYAGKTGVTANDNWFGNNATNYDVEPKTTNVRMYNWLFLNATADPSELDIGENSTIIFRLYDKNSPDVAYDASKMNIKLTLEQTLGELDKTSALLGEEITYTAKNEGDASVTATFETASYTVDLINIKPKTPTSINLTNETMNLKVGDDTPAGATLDPANAGNLTYKSSDESVVTVENGVIKAVGEGTANVTVSFNGTDVYAPAERNISVSVSLNEAIWYYILQDRRRELDGALLSLPFGVYNCLVVNSTGQPLPKGLNVTIKLDDAYTINSTVGDDGIFEVDVNGITPKFYTATFSTYGYTSAVATVLIVKKPTSIALENETMALKVSDEVSAGATLNPAEAGNLTYTSSNSTVAIVENGEIKALAKGTTNITVTFAGDDEYAAAQYKIIEVTVALNDASVTVNNDTLDLLVGDEFTLVAEPVPAGLDVNFTSTDSSVVTVDADGKVTAVGNGTATIVVSVGDDKVYAINTTSVAVTVKIPTEINITNSSVEMYIGGAGEISWAKLIPPEAGSLKYSSNNASVIWVSTSGEFTANGAGTAIITVSFEGNDDYAAAENKTIDVTVKLKDASVAAYDMELIVGSNETIYYFTDPDGLNVTFVQDDSGVYTVDSNGVVTALKEGTGNILIKVGGDGVYAENSTVITVSVSKIPTEITIANATLNVKALNFTFAGATLNPAEAGNLSYNSSNSSVAMVFSGIIFSVGQGNAVITVSYDGNDMYAAAENKTISITVSLNDVSVSVNNSTLDLKVGDTFAINATTVPAIAKMFNVTYNSSDESVVTVDKNGTVTAIGEGNAIITVGVGDGRVFAKNSTEILVTVSKIPTEISVAAGSLDLKVLENFTAGATLTPADAGNLTYTSSNKTVVIVEDGMIMALGEGTATVTVSFAGDYKYAAAENKTIDVTVSLNPASVSVNNSTLELFVDDNFTIVATTVPASLNVTFVQDDSGVYTVDSNGVVTALKEGTGNILIKVGGDGVYAENSTEIAVTVSKIPTEISIATNTLDLKVLENFTAGATLTPADAGNLTYTSSNKTVAIVEDGIIKALGEGTTTITISFDGNDKYVAADNRTIEVTVSLNDASVTVNNSTLDLFVDDNFTIVSTTTPTGLNVTYVQDDSGVYTVDENGTVTALKEGTGNILIKVGGDGIYAENTTTVAVTVSKIPTEIIITNATLDVKVLNLTLAGATLNPSEAGNLTYNSTNSSIVMVISGVIIPVSQGNAIITVSFAGNDKYAEAENKTIAVTVSLNDASVIVENTTLDLKVGDTYTINATTVPEILKLFNVTYTSSDESVVTVDENGTVTAIGEGKAIITVGVGDDRIFAKNSTNITVTVNRIATEITASPVITVYNGGKYLIATLTDAEGNPLSGAQVTIDLNGAKNYTTDENGQVNVSTNGLKPVKIYPATITFAGDEKYLKSTARVNVGVKKATPRITSFNKVFKSTVKNKVYLVALKDNRGNAMKNTRVTLRVGGVTYSAITNAKGIAVFRLTKLTKVGLYNALARYAGNSYYNAVAKKTLVKVAFVTVSKGSKNKAMVKKIQIALKKNGYYLKNGPYTLPIDGIYNTQTVKAVMQFQKAKGLKVTGKVDQRTAKKLKII